MHGNHVLGFTLAELLIALAILGIIAAFTIPKILSAQQDQRNIAITKEAVAMVTAAYQKYKLEHGASATTGISDLTPYMNYASFESSTTMDDKQTLGMQTCNGTTTLCLRLHNGALLRYALSSSYYFGGTSSMDATWFDIDPDGNYSGTTDTGKAIEFWLYYDGRVSSYGNIFPSTCHKGSCTKNPIPAYDPPWFNW